MQARGINRAQRNAFRLSHRQGLERYRDVDRDSSWRAHNMRRAFRGMSILQARCTRPWLFWLHSCQPIRSAGVCPRSGNQGSSRGRRDEHPIEVNDLSVAKGATGSFTPPMHTLKQVNVSIREHLINIQQQYQDKLFLLAGALATEIILRDRRAVGVEFMRGANLYEADKLFA